MNQTSADDRDSSTRILADEKWGPLQRAMFIGVISGCIALACIDLTLALWCFSLFLMSLYGIVVSCKVLAALCGVLSRYTIFVHAEEYAALDDDELPIYTILLPMYKESRVVEKLLTNIGQLDYPKDKLDVKILLEQDDHETLAAIQDFGIPEWCELISIPDDGPKTKPRACNVGLKTARGEYLVIYDAEDRPEPDQLKKVVSAYRQQSEKVVCLQAKLNFFNAKECTLSRWFSLEYTTWFDLYLPGLHAIGAPIPLGGTSNHFKTKALKSLNGWDPYNVTEDCDLGIRVAEAQFETRIIDSVTWEEAPIKISAWLGQRSRWVKGYFQTFWVHSRRPLFSLRKLGPWGFLHMLITVGGQVATLFFNPICWVILIAWLYLQWPIVHVHSPYTLIFFGVSLALFQFNILFMCIHILGAVRRKQYHLIPYAFFLPFYWMLVSIGAWRGVFEFFWAPYKWVKTEHGLSTHSEEMNPQAKQLHDSDSTDRSKPSAFIEPSFIHGFFHNLSVGSVILVLCAILLGTAIEAPHYFGHVAKVHQAQIELTGTYIEAEQMMKLSNFAWGNSSHLRISAEVTPDQAHLTAANGEQNAHAALHEKDLRLMYYMKVRDGEWFHTFIDDFTVVDNIINLDIPLDGPWNSPYDDMPWSRDYLQRVRAFGLRVYSNEKHCSAVHILSIDPIGTLPTTQAVQFTFLPSNISSQSQASTLASYELFEARWLLNKQYANPFDTDVITMDGVFTKDDGTEFRVPAFYTQDYHQFKTAKGEVLQATGAPHWAVRFCAPTAGTYTWHIEGSNADGTAFTSDSQTLTVRHRDHRGFLGIGSNPKYFAFDDGSFFYPLALNIRSPRDEINHDYFDFEMPKKKDGTYVMYDFLHHMKKSGINVGRVWMAPWFGSIEWNADEPGFHGLGIYNLQNAYRLDQIMNKAQSLGIMIELALNQHGPYTQRYDSQWATNPYNKSLGGPARSPRDILTHGDSKKAFKKRFRYICARYGAYENLFAYVLWIEANVVDPRKNVLIAWHKEFAPYMKNIDGDRHLVTTEFNNMGYPRIWGMDDIDYTQVASYNFGKGLVSTMIDDCQALKHYNKPAILEEYMGLPSGGSMPSLAHEFHDGLWLGWMLPLGGAPMPWWWNFIFEKDLDTLYTVFGSFIENENLSDYKWHYMPESKVPGSDSIRTIGRIANDRAFFWVYNTSVSNVRFRGGYNQGRKTCANNYKKAVSAEFSPIAAITSDEKMEFMHVENCELTIPISILQTGTYTVEIWDTWRLKSVHTQNITIDQFPFHMKLPTLTKDIAIKIKPIADQ